MTGYGAAEGTVGRTRVSIDVRSVNHRFFNVTIKLPPELSRWEGEVREALRQAVSRGHVTLNARCERGRSEPEIDEARFGAAVRVLRDLQRRFELDGDVDVAAVLRMPDMIGSLGELDQEDAGELTKLVTEAAYKLRESREREGEKLRDDIVQRLVVIRMSLAKLSERAPQRVVEHRDRLRESIKELAGGVAVDEQRLAQEIAILSERHDVQEELSRFAVHIDAFQKVLNDGSSDGVGKRLGFLLQEMLREANTTASKANDAPMQGDVVTIKEELERIREQVENLE
jgi:uncharacterized protein (TIGR00255 family)